MAPSLLQSVRNSRKSGTLDRFEESLEDQVEALKSELASLTEQLAERSRREGKRARKHAEAGMDELLASGENALAELRDLYHRSGKEVRRTVRQHPLATIGTAAAIGLLVALIARRS